MGLFRRRQEDRSKRYAVKLKKATYAKLGLIASRFGTSEGDALDAIIDFSLASFGAPSQASSSNLNLANIITDGEEGNTDPVMELIKGLLPQLLKGSAGGPNNTGSTIGNQSGPSDKVDVAKALKDLGL